MDDFDGVISAIGPRLRALRVAADVTLAAVSERTGIPVSTLSRLESGGRKPSRELLLPVAKGDVPYLRDVEGTLNDAVRRAAAATGATYVNMSRVSEGHDACQAEGVRWIEPVLQGTNPVVVHPNALGERYLAKRALRVLDLG